MLLCFMSIIRQHKKMPWHFSLAGSLQGGKAAEIMELTLFLGGFFRLMLDLI